MIRKTLLLAGFTALLSTSCNKLIDQKPISSLTEDNFYRNDAEVELGVIGAYSALLPLYNGAYLVTGVRSDETYVSIAEQDYNQLDAGIDNSNNSYLAAYWRSSYAVIKQCNTVLQYIDRVEDPQKRLWYEGEAKFLRAFMHFNLVRLWGPVPLITRNIGFEEYDQFRRRPVDTVYASIIQDLRDASSRLPSTWPADQAGRAFRNSARAALAKVYLTRRDWANAKTILDELLANPAPNTLLSSYASLFGRGNETNSEILFTVRYKSNANGLGNVFSYHYTRLSGAQGLRPFNDMQNSFVAGDLRRAAAITGTGSNALVAKYVDAAPNNDGGADMIVLRWADVVLMHAEAINEISGPTPEAFTSINRIRTRAGLPNLTLATTATQDAFRLAIKRERKVELSFEDNRWFDLLRWNDVVPAMTAHFTAINRPNPFATQAFRVLYPIPQREIDLSFGRLEQNPGY